MSKLVFYVYSKYKDFSLEIENDSEKAFLRYIELVSIFWNLSDKSIEVVPIIQMNDTIKNKYNAFVEKYKTEEVKLNRLKSSLDKIPNSEYFFTSNKSNNSVEQILFIGNLIDVHNATSDDKERADLFQNKIKIQDDIFGDLLKKYDVKVFDSMDKNFIGEPIKKNRTCRFCHEGITEGKTFQKKAHAISEALGNKTIVLYEECDECNTKFGSAIEKDFIQYLDIYRVFFKVKGKNSIPKLKFKNNAVMQNIEKKDIPPNDLLDNTENLIVVMSQNIEHNKETGELKVLLESNNKLKDVNIYKTLCKYALSTIDKNELQYLHKTIKWINQNEEKIKLPKVANVIVNQMYVDVPILSLYIRKDDDYTHPHVVGEFRFKSLIFVFILPFSVKDKIDFTEEKSFHLFWKTFKHYSSINNWAYHDFSCIKEKKYQFNMKINNQNSQKT